MKKYAKPKLNFKRLLFYTFKIVLLWLTSIFLSDWKMSTKL